MLTSTIRDLSLFEAWRTLRRIRVLVRSRLGFVRGSFENEAPPSCTVRTQIKDSSAFVPAQPVAHLEQKFRHVCSARHVHRLAAGLTYLRMSCCRGWRPHGGPPTGGPSHDLRSRPDSAPASEQRLCWVDAEASVRMHIHFHNSPRRRGGLSSHKRYALHTCKMYGRVQSVSAAAMAYVRSMIICDVSTYVTVCMF